MTPISAREGETQAEPEGVGPFPESPPPDAARQLLDDICLRLMSRGWTLAATSTETTRELVRGRHRLSIQHHAEPLSLAFELHGHRVLLPMQRPNFAPFGEWPFGLGMEFWLAARHPQPDAHRRMHEEWERERERAARFPGARPWVSWVVAALLLGLQWTTAGGRADLNFVWGSAYLMFSLHNQPWRLLSYSLLHDGWWAALPCLGLLLWVGPRLERILGAVAWLALWTSGALGGILLSYAVRRTELSSTGCDGALWGLLSSYALLALPLRQHLPQALRLEKPWWLLAVFLLEAYFVQRQWLFFDPWLHLGGALAGASMTLLLLGPNWTRWLRWTGCLLPTALAAVVLTQARWPHLTDYPARRFAEPSHLYSLSLPAVFYAEQNHWIGPGLAVTLEGGLLDEAEASYDWPRQAEQVWAAWRQQALEWAAVQRLAPVKAGSRVWWLSRLRPYDRGPIALSALTVDHESYYLVTLRLAVVSDGSEVAVLSRWLETLAPEPIPPAECLRRADEFQQRGAIALPLRLAQRAVEQDPDNLAAQLKVLYLLLELGRDARPVYRQVERLASTPEQRRLALRAQASALAPTRFAESRRILDELARRPQAPDEQARLHNTRAWLETLYGQPELALQEAEKAVAGLPSSYTVGTYAAALTRLGRYREALPLLEQCLAERPNLADEFFRALALEGLGRKEEARQVFDQLRQQPSQFQTRAEAHYRRLGDS